MSIENFLLFLVQGTAVGTFLLFLAFVYLPKARHSSSRSLFFDSWKSRVYFALFTLFYTALFGVLFLLNDKPTSQPWYTIGVLIAVSGLLLAFSARMMMRKVWSPVTHTEKSAEVIQSGPFAITRHPVYAGRIMFFVGVMLMLNFYGLVLAIPYWFVLRKHALYEEETLAKSSVAYRKYMQKVKRVLF